MIRWLAPALMAGTLALCLAACGDTRSNQTLNGVATWPGGGPAFGPWQGPDYTYTYSYAPSYPPYDYGSSGTTTTTTVYPGYR
jgi:hypothetical protein